jgi:plastocyanin
MARVLLDVGCGRVMDTDETFSCTFEKPGTYTYFCSVHPKMTGQVVVKMSA